MNSISCGVENAAALTSDGKLLLWGNKANMPATMLGKSKALPALQPAHDLRTAGISRGCSAPEASFTGGMQHDNGVGLQLHVHSDDSLKITLACGTPKHQEAALGSDRQTQQGHLQQPYHPSKQISSNITSSDSDDSDQHTGNDRVHQQHGQPQNMFDPDNEHVTQLGCGESHYVLLTQPSKYQPTTAEVREAITSILHGYIRSCTSKASSTLPLHNTLGTSNALERGGSLGGPAMCGSDAGSTANTRYAASVVSGTTQASGAVTGGRNDGHSSVPITPAVKAAAGRISKSHSTVSAGKMSSRSYATGAANPAVEEGSVLNAGNDKDAPTSHHQGTVHGDTSDEDVAAQTSSGMPAGEVGVHAVMLLCREVGLVDNLTQHRDVRGAFELVLHRKRGRMGPLVKSAAGMALGEMHHSSKRQRKGQPSTSTANSLAATVVPPADPVCDHITVVPVIRPGAGSPLKGPLRAAQDVNGSSKARHQTTMLMSDSKCSPPPPAAATSTSPGESITAGHFGTTSVRGGVESVNDGHASAALNSTSAGRAALTVDSLNADELLEVLIVLMKNRHPELRKQVDVLHRVLACVYIARLKGRKPDKGPSSLLRQLLQQDMLKVSHYDLVC